MAHTYLGEEFDIHGGGLDLVFPHHENEIAQSEAAGYGFAKVWMHNAWVTQSGEKMSKSLGNSLLVREILKQIRGVELRWYLSGAHYRSMLEFSFEALEESAINFRRIETFLKRINERSGIDLVIDTEFKEVMDDDLAVPQALALISSWLRAGNTALAAGDERAALREAERIRGALSILGADPFDDTFASLQGNNDAVIGALDGLIHLLLKEREEARARKDFASADRIRDSFQSLGIAIEDGPDGPRWSIQ
jgi:cysteinyl-tRNA synthetase